MAHLWEVAQVDGVSFGQTLRRGIGFFCGFATTSDVRLEEGARGTQVCGRLGWAGVPHRSPLGGHSPEAWLGCGVWLPGADGALLGDQGIVVGCGGEQRLWRAWTLAVRPSSSALLQLRSK